MGVETHTGECEGVNTEGSMSSSRTEPSSIPGAAERLKSSSQGEQVLKFSLKFHVLTPLESSNQMICELPKTENPWQFLFVCVVHCLAISSLPLHSFVLVRPKYTRDAIIDLENVTPIPHTQTKDHWPVDAMRVGSSYCTWGLHSDISESRKWKNILAGVTASIDTHMPSFSSKSLT